MHEQAHKDEGEWCKESPAMRTKMRL